MSTTDVQEIKEQLTDLQGSVNSMLDLIRGNKLNPDDKGLLGDLMQQDVKIKLIEANVNVLLEDKRRFKWAMGKLLVGGGVLIGLVEFILSQFFKK